MTNDAAKNYCENTHNVEVKTDYNRSDNPMCLAALPAYRPSFLGKGSVSDEDDTAIDPVGILSSISLYSV